MKKMLAIIMVLLIIFIGMLIHTKNTNQNKVTVSEVQQIEEYLTKIYLWQEVTEEALPKFDNINNASDLWTWEVVKKNLESFELSKEEIEEKAIELFGKNFTKSFPDEGSEFIIYDKETGLYYTNGMGLDSLEDSFFIKKINKLEDTYQVEIIEYLEDYENSIDEEGNLLDEYNIDIMNLDRQVVLTFKNTEGEERAIEMVKENLDKFSSKSIILKKGAEGNLNVESVR